MLSLFAEIVILILVGALNILFGFFIFPKGKKTKADKVFILILINLALWSWALAFARTTSDPKIALFATRLLYGTSAFIPYLFIIFVSLFTARKNEKAMPWHLLLIPLIIILPITFFSSGIIKNVSFENGTDISHFGGLYALFALYLVTYFSIGLFITLRKFLKAPINSIERAQLKFIFAGVVIPIVIGIITNIFFLAILKNFDYRWLGPASTLILTAFFGYAIFKHHLFNIRVIATELFTALILIVVLIDTLLSDTTAEFATRISVFAVVLTFGIFLIRGTLREIRELERLSHAKSEFVSIVSHQLRTPLTAIKGFISMIREGSGTEENRKEWLKKTYISNERLIRLVNDILNISRIERGTLQYNFKETDIINLINDIVEELRAQTEGKGLSMAWEKPSGGIPRLHADEEKLRQVFINLIDNSIKYTEKGSVIVRLLYLRDLKKVRVVVQDTGMGMEKEEIEKLFNLFSRGDGGEKTHTEGVGLGLYVARKIVEAHKGKIWTESEGLHKGSKFIVELPV